MRLLWVLAFFALISSNLSFGQSPAVYQNHLLPVPTHVEVQPGRLLIDGQFKVSLDGSADGRLISAANRFVDRLEGRTAIQLSHALGKDPAARLLVRVKSDGERCPATGRRRVVCD